MWTVQSWTCAFGETVSMASGKPTSPSMEAPLLEVDHNTDILDAGAGVKWVDRYFELLRAAIRDPAHPLEETASRF